MESFRKELLKIVGAGRYLLLQESYHDEEKGELSKTGSAKLFSKSFASLKLHMLNGLCDAG